MRRALLSWRARASWLRATPTPGPRGGHARGDLGLDPATGQTSFLAQQEELQGATTAITRGRSSPGSTP